MASPPPTESTENKRKGWAERFRPYIWILMLLYFVGLMLHFRFLNLRNLTITESIVLRNEAGKVVADLRVDKVSGEPSLRLTSGDGRSVIEMGMIPNLQDGSSFSELSISRDSKRRITARSGFLYAPVGGNITTSDTAEIIIHDDLSRGPAIELGHTSGYSRLAVRSGARLSSGPSPILYSNNRAEIYATPNDGPIWISLKDSSGTIVWSQSSAHAAE